MYFQVSNRGTLDQKYQNGLKMTIKEKTIKELESLNNHDLRVVYDIIKSLKRKHESREYSGESYMKVREALKNVKGSLSTDIINSRSDRV